LKRTLHQFLGSRHRYFRFNNIFAQLKNIFWASNFGQSAHFYNDIHIGMHTPWEGLHILREHVHTYVHTYVLNLKSIYEHFCQETFSKRPGDPRDLNLRPSASLEPFLRLWVTTPPL
jgi:hypothetical protein